MKEEKMMILTMLEEGKITSEEAIKLMEALEDIERPSDYEEVKNEKEEVNDNYREKKPFNPQIFNALGDIGSDIGNALSNMFDGLKDVSYSFGFRNNYETITENIDYDLDSENPSLDLNAINGSINLIPIDGNKLKIKAICQYKKGLFSDNETFFNFSANGNKIVFSPRYNNSISIKLDVSIPKKHYDEILLNSTNGKINVEELNANSLIAITTNSSIDVLEVNAKDIDLTTKNGRIECKDINCSKSLKAYTTNSNIFLMYVNSPDIDVKTANAKIGINDISADNIICKTSNSPIEADDIICDLIHLITSNSKIILSNINTNKVKEIKLVTSNGSIDSQIHSSDKALYFDLETSMGNINLEMPNLMYKVNKQVNLGLKKIVAHSSNFDENSDYLKFIASTSNGSIKVY